MGMTLGGTRRAPVLATFAIAVAVGAVATGLMAGGRDKGTVETAVDSFVLKQYW